MSLFVLLGVPLAGWRYVGIKGVSTLISPPWSSCLAAFRVIWLLLRCSIVWNNRVQENALVQNEKQDRSDDEIFTEYDSDDEVFTEYGSDDEEKDFHHVMGGSDTELTDDEEMFDTETGYFSVVPCT